MLIGITVNSLITEYESSCRATKNACKIIITAWENNILLCKRVCLKILRRLCGFGVFRSETLKSSKLLKGFYKFHC